MGKEVIVVAQEEVQAKHYQLILHCPEIVKQAEPGQFLHIKCGQSLDPLLRRPISIHSINKDRGELTLLYRLVGKGTKLLSEVKAGESLDILGPLGHGFTLSSQVQTIALVGGGIGAAPLFALAETALAAGKKVHFLLGAANKASLLTKENLLQLGVDLAIATDDGSEGWQGNVVQLLAEMLGKEKIDYLYGCGPHPMLKGLAELAEKMNIECEVALEEKMACGVGACLGCVCKTKAVNGEETYSKVCQHGPVFKAKEVKWND